MGEILLSIKIHQFIYDKTTLRTLSHFKINPFMVTAFDSEPDTDVSC